MKVRLLSKAASDDAAKEIGRVLKARGCPVDTAGDQVGLTIVERDGPTVSRPEMEPAIAGHLKTFAAWAVEAGLPVQLAVASYTVSSTEVERVDLSSDELAKLATDPSLLSSNRRLFGKTPNLISRLLEIVAEEKGEAARLLEELRELAETAGVDFKKSAGDYSLDGVLVDRTRRAIQYRDRKIAETEGALASTAAKLAECEQQLALLTSRHVTVANQRNRALRSLRRVRKAISIA